MDMLTPVRRRLGVGALFAAASVPCSMLVYVAIAEIIAALLRGSGYAAMWMERSQAEGWQIRSGS